MLFFVADEALMNAFWDKQLAAAFAITLSGGTFNWAFVLLNWAFTTKYWEVSNYAKAIFNFEEPKVVPRTYHYISLAFGLLFASMYNTFWLYSVTNTESGWFNIFMKVSSLLYTAYIMVLATMLGISVFRVRSVLKQRVQQTFSSSKLHLNEKLMLYHFIMVCIQ